MQENVRRSAAARCARSTARSGSVPITSPRTGLPTTGSTGYKAYNLDQVLDGDLEPVIQSAIEMDEQARLDAIGD
jgi:protein subunit release factor A